MAIVDDYYIDIVNKLLQDGQSDKSMSVRPKWPDGTPAHTIKLFGNVFKYNLEKEFPILTLRKQAFNTAVKELLWMWQKKSNNINDLKAHIWDSWADDSGSIGKTYGYQLSKKYLFSEGIFDQVDYLIYNLKYNPASRRIITTMWNNEDLKDMNLAPCVYETIWDVTPDKKLNMLLIQRSGDLLAAAGPGGFDCVEYALLQYAMAQVCGYKPGIFMHVINNLHIYDRHIYDRHINIAKSICLNKKYPAPKLIINSDIHDWYKFTPEDFKLENYQATKLIEPFEVAI